MPENSPEISLQATLGKRVRQRRMTCGFTVEKLADLADLNEKTVRRIEAGDGTPSPTSITQIANALHVDVKDLVNGPTPEPSLLPKDVSGRWLISGGDIKMRKYFNYKIKPKKFKGRVEITQAGSRVVAKGDDHDNDPVHFWGELLEGGRFLRGNYAIDNPRMHVAGVVMAEYLGDGTIEGHYIGLDTGHRTPLIFGWLRLEPEQDDLP